MKADIFEALYQSNQDPWNYLTSDYERRKYQHSLSVLSKSSYRHGIEIGCSIGVLTERLSDYCETLTGVDCSQTALERAATYCAHRSNIRFVQAQLPMEWPFNKSDLILFSEILYYFTPQDIKQLAILSQQTLDRDGQCLLVNYDEPIDEAVQGKEAALIFIDAFCKSAGKVHVDNYRGDHYTIHSLTFKKV